MTLPASGAHVTQDYGVPGDYAAGIHTGRDYAGGSGAILATRAGTVADKTLRTESYRADFTVRRDGKLVELPDVQFDTWQDEQGQTHMTLGFTVYGLKKTNPKTNPATSIASVQFIVPLHTVPHARRAPAASWKRWRPAPPALP